MRDPVVKVSDIVFTAIIVAVVLFVWFIAIPKEGGNTVVFRQDGEIVGKASLNEDTEITIEGDYTNVFTIKDGEVRVTYTDCPNHLCEKMGAVGSGGGSIVCAPNRVSATVEGSGPDAVAG